RARVAQASAEGGSCGGGLALIRAWAVAVAAIWIVATIYGQLGKPDRAASLPQSPVAVLSSWDGAHYRHIAEHGYSTEPMERRRLGFFPLFPFLCNVLGGGKHAGLAGIVLNQLLLLGVMLLLTGLSPEGGDVPLRKQPGFWLLVSPFAFFFSVL